MGVKSSPICFHDRALQAFEAWEEETYTHIRSIAPAQCGQVDLFEDRLSGEQFAVKIMPKEMSRPNMVLICMMREAAQIVLRIH